MARKVKVPATWPEALSDHVTLAEAKAWLRDQVATGALCPCCTQTARVYRRPIHAGMARALVVMYREHGGDWQDKTVTLKGVGSAARDESLLRFWGLLEEHPGPRDDGGRAGWWRVTDLGMAFARGEAMVQSHCFLYDNRSLGLDGSMVDIRHCLGRRFDLRELMGGGGE